MKAATIIWMLLTFFAIQATSFVPNQSFGFPTSSETHDSITRDAVRVMAIEYMDDYPARYPDQAATLASSEFVDARTRILSGVASPDNSGAVYTPSIHVGSEAVQSANTLMLNLRASLINFIRADDIAVARFTLGRILHTLQDFYSHTNWIELGHTDINDALADPARTADIGTVAMGNQDTCNDCPRSFGTSCPNNILNFIIDQGLLTSGYREDKPTSGVLKCGHGGLMDLGTRRQPIGGINKDSDSVFWSPHHHLHSQAAGLAVKASVAFLKQIRSVRSDQEFARLLGLQVGVSLCFVVDTTGSMSDEISAVRDETIKLTQDRAGSMMAPTDYVLAPFNDPDFGPVFKTTDANAMINMLSSLTADGGGDEPEFAFSGLNLALDVVRPGSECFLFTDASAKDSHLLPTSLSLIALKKVKTNVVLTGFGGLKKRRKRAISPARRRVKRQTPLNYYLQLALASGGLYIEGEKEDISEILNVVDTTLTTVEVTLLNVDSVQGDGVLEFDLPIDQTVKDVVVTLTTSSDVLDLAILDPSGNPSTGVTNITNLNSFKLLQIPTPEEGVWTVRVEASGMFSLRVTGSSLLQFTYQFVEFVNSTHPGYFPVNGRPLADTDVTFFVLLNDGYTSTDTPDNRGLVEVSHLRLVSRTGELLQQHDLQELLPLSQYVVTTVLPDQEFRVVLEGKDAAGNKVQRWDSVAIVTAVSMVSVGIDAGDGFSLLPGESLVVNATVTNYGPPGTYLISISDTRSFTESFEPSQLILNTDDTALVAIRNTVPLNATSGQSSTVSVIARRTDGTDENFVVYQVTVANDVIDETNPVCDIVDREENCSMTHAGLSPCDQESWSIDFVTYDSGIGLYVVKPDSIHKNSTFFVTAFEVGTTEVVSGNYTSTCCNPRVSIVASDILGRAATCSVDYTIPTTAPEVPTPEKSPLSGTTAVVLFCIGGLILLVIACAVAMTAGPSHKKINDSRLMPSARTPFPVFDENPGMRLSFQNFYRNGWANMNIGDQPAIVQLKYM